MIRLTKDMKKFLQDYTLEMGESSKEHRRGSTFYLSAECTITEGAFEDAADEDIVLPPELDGMVVVIYGTWSENDGTDVGLFDIRRHQQTMNPKYVELMTRAQEDGVLQDFIKEHCEEYVVKTEKVDFEVI